MSGAGRNRAAGCRCQCPPRQQFCSALAHLLEWSEALSHENVLPDRLFKFLIVLAMLYATPAHALTEEVNAPDEIKALLTQHLETARAARQGEKLDAEEIARLQQQSEQTARDLLATEGYFSPQVESAVVRVGDDWRVVYRVDPGVRTTVRSVKLIFEGSLKTRADAAALRDRIARSFS